MRNVSQSEDDSDRFRLTNFRLDFFPTNDIYYQKVFSEKQGIRSSCKHNLLTQWPPLYDYIDLKCNMYEDARETLGTLLVDNPRCTEKLLVLLLLFVEEPVLIFFFIFSQYDPCL